MKNFRILTLMAMTIAFAALAGSCRASDNTVKTVRYTSTTDPTLTVAVDSVVYRSDLARLYGKLVGRPHTSSRIDSVSLLSGKTSVEANDIDGVDFRRYFQWEDDGQIPVEIDFPPLKPLNGAQLVVVTPRGESVTTIKRKR